MTINAGKFVNDVLPASALREGRRQAVAENSSLFEPRDDRHCVDLRRSYPASRFSEPRSDLRRGVVDVSVTALVPLAPARAPLCDRSKLLVVGATG